MSDISIESIHRGINKMKKWIAYKSDKLKLIIEEDANVGYYLLIYNLPDMKNIADYLQDSLEAAIEQAYELYGIKRDSWQPYDEL